MDTMKISYGRSSMLLVDTTVIQFLGKSSTNIFKERFPEENCFDRYNHRYDHENITDR